MDKISECYKYFDEAHDHKEVHKMQDGYCHVSIFACI